LPLTTIGSLAIFRDYRQNWVNRLEKKDGKVLDKFPNINLELENTLMNFLEAVDRIAALMEQYRDHQHSDDGYLTKREALVLSALEEGDLGITQIVEKLSATSTISEAAVSNILKRLFAEKGYVKKYISPKNQRIKMVRLMKKGRDALERDRQHRQERFEALRAAMNLTPDEERFAVKLLLRAIKAFGKLGKTDVVS